MATIYADRTRLNGDYHLGTRDGTFRLAGDYAADSATLDPSMFAGVTQPLAAAAKTPLGPVAGAIGDAVRRTAANFNAAGKIRVVNFPGGGAARVDTADVIGPNGARARVFGGSGVTYYWPTGGLRIDGEIEMAGGGLPSGRVSLRQAARRRSDARRGRIRAVHRRRLAARAGSDPLRPGPRRIDRAQHARPARWAVPRRQGPGAESPDRRPDRQRRKLRLRHFVRGGELQLSAHGRAPAWPDPAADMPGRAGDRVQAAGRSGASPAPGSAGRCSTDASATRRSIWPRPAAGSSASVRGRSRRHAPRQAGFTHRIRCRDV